MAGKTQHNYPPDDELLRRVGQKGMTQVAIDLGISRGALQHHVAKVRAGRAETEQPGITQHEDGRATVVSDADLPKAWTPEQLLRESGLDINEWKIVRTRVNRWGSPDDPKYQVRVDVVPIAILIQLPDPKGWTPPPKPKKARPTKDKPIKVVVCGDHHAPHHDKNLHKVFCKWLADEKPEAGILLGDLLDAATVSRHRPRDQWSQGLNEGLRAAFELLMDYRHASPDTQWTLLPGNHDARIQHAVIDKVSGLHNLTAADDDVPALSLRRLLHLDDLGIDFAGDSDADWDNAKAPISKRLVARHGVSTSKNATQVMLNKLARTSTIQGHSHRMGIDYSTQHDEVDLEEPTSTRMGAEAGCMCEIKDGLGYTVQPDWQQGALLNWVYPNGDFLTAPLVYVPGRLLAPNGKRYEV
jgi:hypothetical protein